MSPALYLLVGWLHARQQHTVPLHKLYEAVADGVAGSSDSDGLHHPRVPQLAHTQVPVEQLLGTEPRVSALEALLGTQSCSAFSHPNKGPERPGPHS